MKQIPRIFLVIGFILVWILITVICYNLVRHFTAPDELPKPTQVPVVAQTPPVYTPLPEPTPRPVKQVLTENLPHDEASSVSTTSENPEDIWRAYCTARQSGDQKAARALRTRTARGPIQLTGTERVTMEVFDNGGYLELDQGSSFIALKLEKGGWKLGEQTSQKPSIRYGMRIKFAQVNPLQSENDPDEPYTRVSKSGATAAPPRPTIQEELIHRKDRGDGLRRIALTFDACWKASPRRYDARVIEILRQTQTPATLFLGGHWMEQFPKETRELGRNPLFEIANHTYLHIHPTQVSPQVLAAELRRTESVFYQLTGQTMAPYYRPPFGEYNDSTRQIAAQYGFSTVHWSVETGDPDKNQTADRIVSESLQQIKPGGVVVMHMNGNGWHTAEALPILIKELRARDYKFVKISEL